MTENSTGPQELQPKIRDLDLANVVGFAARDRIYKAQAVKSQGDPELADMMLAKAYETGEAAGRVWLSDKKDQLQGEALRLAEESARAYADALQLSEVGLQVGLSAPKTPEEPEIIISPDQVGIPAPTAPEGYGVSPEVIARVAAAVASRNPEEPIRRVDLVRPSGVSQNTVPKVLAFLVDYGFLETKKGAAGSLGGRPPLDYIKTEKFEHYLAHVAEWRETTEVIKAAERSNLAVEDARNALIRLGRASLLKDVSL